MDGDKDKPVRKLMRWIDYYRTPKYRPRKKVPSKVEEKRRARRDRRHRYSVKIDMNFEGI